MIYGVLSLAVPAVFLFILKEFFDLYLFQRDMQSFKLIIIWSTYFIFDFLVRYNWSFSTVLSIFYNIIVLTILCKIVYTDEIKRVITIVLFVECLGCIAETIVGYFLIILLNAHVEYELFGSIFSKLFLLIIVRVIKIFRIYKYRNNFPIKYWILNISLSVGSLYIIDSLFFINKYKRDSDLLGRAILAAVILLIINVVSFKVFDKIMENADYQRKSTIYKQQISFFNMQKIEREETMIEMRKFKHDFVNHITCIRELISNLELERAMQYLESLSKLDDLTLLPFEGSGNLLIDAILKSKYTIAEKYGISISSALEIPQCLPFEDTDICVIVGNALDNAIEALQYSTIEPKEIIIEIKMRHKNFILYVKNRYDNKIIRDNKGNIITSKKDKNNHGIGLNSIKRAVQKYNGILDIDTANKMFTIGVLLYSS